MSYDQRLVFGDVEYLVAGGADVVVGPGAGYTFPQRAVSRREMVNVTVVQRVPGVVFGQPRRVSTTGTRAVVMMVLHWKNKNANRQLRSRFRSKDDILGRHFSL